MRATRNVLGRVRLGSARRGVGDEDDDRKGRDGVTFTVSSDLDFTVNDDDDDEDDGNEDGDFCRETTAAAAEKPIDDDERSRDARGNGRRL